MTIPRPPIRSPTDDVLQWCLEQPAPESYSVGTGSAIPLVGWCFHRRSRIKVLRFLTRHSGAVALAHSLPRPDVRAALFPHDDRLGRSYASGFYAVLPISGVDRSQPLDIFLQVELSNGRVETRAVDRLIAEPRRALQSAHASRAPIMICMATYDPPYEQFARQIESIAGQTRGDWLCLVSDDRSRPDSFDRMARLLAGDDRFVLERSLVRRGAYHNFERVLELVGTGPRFVALADQDDRWYPHKLEALADALGSGAMLAYSDCRIVGSAGSPLSSTFFPTRRNNWSDLGRMILANTVTGASSMFRRELLDTALPFPPSVGAAFHDHWLACAALALGELSYIEEPLYDYVQHDENLLGHALGNEFDHREHHRGEPRVLRDRSIYANELTRAVTLARTLEQRVGARIQPSKRRELASLAELESSRVALGRMALHAISASRARSSTLGAERDLVRAVIWRRRMARIARGLSKFRDPRYSSAIERPEPTSVIAGRLGAVGQLVDETEPLALAVSPSSPQRVNILVPSPDFEAGHVTAFRLAAHIGKLGYRVRMLALENSAPPPGWREDQLELADASPRHGSLEVSERDVFVATTWSTAHIAHAATIRLGQPRFLYVIHEFEPASFPPGSFTSEAERTYGLPHCALFATEPLRAQFESHRVGVYADGNAAGDRDSMTFADAITPIAAPTAAELRARQTRRLLFCARAEPHAARTMFELGTMALSRAARAGALAGWEVNGIGPAPGHPAIELAPGFELAMLGRFDRSEYAQLLRGHDVGLALMATPHPSLVALEMASAGMTTVTSESSPWLESRSGNVIVVAPSPAAIGQGILRAIERTPEFDARAAGSMVDWPEGFDQARLAELLGRCGRTEPDQRGARASSSSRSAGAFASRADGASPAGHSIPTPGSS